MSRRLTGDFTGMLRVPLSNINNDNETPTTQNKPSACTTIRIVEISNTKKFPFSKAQLTISLESEKVRISCGARAAIGSAVGSAARCKRVTHGHR